MATTGACRSVGGGEPDHDGLAADLELQTGVAAVRDTGATPESPKGGPDARPRGRRAARLPGVLTIAAIAADGEDPGDWRLDDPSAWRPALPFGDSGVAPVSIMAGDPGLKLQISGEPVVVRLTTSDVSETPPVVATDTTDLDPADVPGDTLSPTINGRRPCSASGPRCSSPAETPRRCRWPAATAAFRICRPRFGSTATRPPTPAHDPPGGRRAPAAVLQRCARPGSP